MYARVGTLAAACALLCGPGADALGRVTQAPSAQTAPGAAVLAVPGVEGVAAAVAPAGAINASTAGRASIRSAREDEHVDLFTKLSPSEGAAKGDEALHAADVSPEWDTDIWALFDFKMPFRHRMHAAVPPSPKRHPLWVFSTHHLAQYSLAITCVALIFAGILCAAGGIGGGGIFVTLLMVAGKLPIGDAVPLSKAIVFVGALTTLPMNLKKITVGDSLIDANICRLVVPGSLAGTYIGVFLNRLLPGWLVVLVLVLVLVFITVTTARTTFRAYASENMNTKTDNRGCIMRFATIPEGDENEEDEVEGAARGVGNAGSPSSPQEGGQGGGSSTSIIKLGSSSKVVEEEYAAAAGRLTKMDALFFFGLLFIVIFCSTLRFHTQSCRLAPAMKREVRCHHPVWGWIGAEGLGKIASHASSAEAVSQITFFFPLALCLASAVLFGVKVCRESTGFWSPQRTCGYVTMGVFAGVLAGLVGIGGGLFFSPFFVIMGHYPAVAVATSSTCVLFTSSSTTIQYLLTDRIIVSLAIVYGFINLFASIVGTRIVYFLEDRFSGRKSYIMMIVLFGVFISLVLACINLGQEILPMITYISLHGGKVHT